MTFFIPGKPISKGSFVGLLHPRLKAALDSDVVTEGLSRKLVLAGLLQEGYKHEDIEKTVRALRFEKWDPKTGEVETFQPVLLIPQNSKNLKDWDGSIFKEASKHLKNSFGVSPISLTLTFFIQRPQHHFRSNGQLKNSAPKYPTGRTGDWDKLSRSVCDALHKVAYEDDSQIVKVSVEKVYAGADGPGVTITVEEIREEGLFG